jgi:hypothetical protein
MIVNYYRNNRFIVLATINTLVNYDRKTFIVQATGCTILVFFDRYNGFWRVIQNLKIF